MEEIQFKEQEITIPENLPKGGSCSIKWDFEGDPTKIVYLKPGCGCTAECKVEGNTVVAVYTDQTSSNLVAGLYPFSKNITVYLESDKELWTASGMGKIINPSKERIVLKFSGVMEVK